MEINQALQRLEKVLMRLDHMLQKFNQAQKDPAIFDEEDIIAYRDSCIKRFEMSFDLFWKIVKEYLEKTYLVAVASPKKIFHECFQRNIIDEQETSTLLEMVDDRNLTIHTYDENMAKEISQRIGKYYTLMRAIPTRFK
jgi:nucleotidyltransferase substrate binding protein (TIGR01987 family)